MVVSSKQWGQSVYTRGKYIYFDYCEFDKISLVELSNVAAEVGYCGHCTFYYGNELQGRFMVMEHDRDVSKMSN